MGAWMRRFWPKSIRSRMMLMCMFLSIVPILVIGTVAYRTSTHTIIQQVVKIHQYNIDTYDRSIMTAFRTLYRATQDFLYGEETAGGKVVTLLEKESDYYENLSVYKKYELKKTLDERVKRLIPYNFDAKKVVLSNRKGFTYTQSLKEGETYTDIDTRVKDDTYAELYEKALVSKNREVFSRKDENTFNYMRLIYSLSDFKPKGFLLLEVDNNILESILPAGEELDSVMYAVVDTLEEKAPIPVFWAGNLDKPEELIQKYYMGELDIEKQWNVGKLYNEASGWDVLFIADTGVLAEKAKNINMITIIMVFVMSILVLFLGIWMSHIINRPLMKLGNAIRRVGEDGDYRITETFGEDEIGRIGRQFSQMVEQNLVLKDSLYQTKIKQKEAELIALQAQINPHFLYNTLDAIYLMTQMGRGLEAGEMTLALSEIFRTSLNKGQEFTRVKDEVRHIGNYLYIQQKRYGDKIKYHINVQEDIMEERMLKLVLQPIIENAIYHGLEQKALSGSLCIEGSRGDQHMAFTISDDGVGMANEEWKNGYGLSNVRERLKLYYGKEYDLQVQSKVNEGTCVTVYIPLGAKSF